MAAAFQSSAFQNNAFQTAGVITSSIEGVLATARLGAGRLNTVRLAAIMRVSQLKPGTALYAWTRSDGPGGAVNDGRPPGASAGGWTTGRS